MKNHGDFTSLSAFESWLTSHNVSSGTPTDIQIGDFFSIMNGSYLITIAGIDTELKKGNAPLTSHHITGIVYVGKYTMNSTNTTVGGYAGSVMNNTVLPNKEAEFSSIFGSHLLNRRVCLTNQIGSDGKSNRYDWYDKLMTLMSEQQLYGSIQFGNQFDTGEAYEKLPIFDRIPVQLLFGRNSIWLRGINTAATFCCMSGAGLPSASGAANTCTTIAVFCLG